MRVSVMTEEVFAAIDKEYPDLTNAELSRRLDYDESNLRRTRKYNRMEFDKADRLLTAVGLGHLLSDGTIEVHAIPARGNPKKHFEPTSYEKLQAENLRLQRENHKLRQQLAAYADRFMDDLFGVEHPHAA